ncbi:phosphate transport system substrate-binding protein [Hymenobacter daecheongensis DSM 21074]|uniref:Phosphate transport system substrate-binding protein n=1 Tax=Hymenobacter daecheongensis DSM 21074 TaxID=1121955 RepID=A0A1M6A3T4_9BACT|nr:substrate-binding domain-containing protein [Hymenobacter daecheongensis]SHI31174.1 phosphate transport system substrate-binding protein [Hymenobacter daecheongensis DSM 21074]
MNNNLWKAGVALALSSFSLVACNSVGNSGAAAETDTTTSGSISISVDETFAPILASQVDTFQKLYQSAKVKAAYKPEQAAIQDLIDNKARVIVVARQLTGAETAEFDRLKLVPRAIKLATDGLAIIVHPSNPDSLLTIAQLRDIFTGKTADWNQVSGKKKLGAINVVFDANRSSTARYVQDSVTRGAALTQRVFAAKSNPALLDYVATHPSAIGVVGANWISDRDDEAVQRFLKRVRVVGISANPNPQKAEDYVQPYQAYMALKTYPLRRDVYLISREARAGLGTGFASFAAGNKGQLIILKSGLVPAVGQTRIINTNKL